MPISASSIRVRLMLVVLLAVLPALGIILADGFAERDNAASDAAEGVERIALHLAGIQQRTADSTRQMLMVLAEIPEVQRLDTARCTEMLRALVAGNPVYANLMLANLEGDIVASGQRHPAVNIADRRHFREAISNREFSSGGYAVSRTTRVPVLAYSYPVHDGRSVLRGVLVASMRLDAYESLFAQSGMSRRESMCVIDHDGTRLFHHPMGEISSPLGQPVSPDIWFRISGPEESGQASMTGPDGVRRIFAWRQLRLRPSDAPYAHLLVGIPEAPAKAKANRLLMRNVAWLGAAGLLAAVAALRLGGRYIARPIETLTLAARNVGGGDLRARTGLAHDASELGRLAQAFDGMADSLERLAQARQLAELELTCSEQTYHALFEEATDPIFLADAGTGILLDCNKEAVRMLGYAKDEIVGQHQRMLHPPAEGIGGFTDCFDKHRGQSHDQVLDDMLLTRDGRRIDVAIKARAFELLGRRVMLGIFRDISQPKRHAREREAALREKELLLREVHHRVKNNLQIITSLLYLQAVQTGDPAARGLMEECRQRIASIALVHQELYGSSDLACVSLREYVLKLAQRLDAAFRSGKDIHLSFDLDDVAVAIDAAVPMGLILNELITNAYKHAFVARDRGVIRLAVKRTRESIVLRVEDDGVGLAQGFDPWASTSLGMQLVVSLCEQLRGRLRVLADAGAGIELVVPAAQPDHNGPGSLDDA